jgi:hypothetical protein
VDEQPASSFRLSAGLLDAWAHTSRCQWMRLVRRLPLLGRVGSSILPVGLLAGAWGDPSNLMRTSIRREDQSDHAAGRNLSKLSITWHPASYGLIAADVLAHGE